MSEKQKSFTGKDRRMKGSLVVFLPYITSPLGEYTHTRCLGVASVKHKTVA